MRWLKELREERGVQQIEIADFLDINKSTYHYYETQAKGCNLRILDGIRRFFGLSWEELGERITLDLYGPRRKTLAANGHYPYR